MQTKDLTESLSKHPFIANLPQQHHAILAGCSTNVVYKNGDVICHEGELASKLFLIRTGRVAIEVRTGKQETMRIQTLGPGDILGWDFITPPYRWHFDAVAVDDVKAFALDGKCLRTKCETDHHFGYEVLLRLSEVCETRIQATRIQLIDVYAVPQ